MANTTILAKYLVIADVDLQKPSPTRGLTCFCRDTLKSYYCYDNVTWIDVTIGAKITLLVSDETTQSLLQGLSEKVELLTNLIQENL